LQLNWIEADNPARPIPDFDGAFIEILLCLFSGGPIVGAFQDSRGSGDMAVLIEEENAIFMHGLTSCVGLNSKLGRKNPGALLCCAQVRTNSGRFGEYSVNATRGRTGECGG
jgi:hypothetical protein